MSDRAEIRSGAFVLMALLTLGAFSLWIAGYDPLGKRKNPYEVHMTSAAGVRVGDDVRMAGVDIGRIEQLELRPGHQWPVRFVVAIDPEVTLTPDTTARFSSDGLLGSAYLDLVSGPPEQEPLPAGSIILGSTGSTMTDVLTAMGTVAARLEVLIDQTGSTLTEISTELVPTLERAQQMMSEENSTALSAALIALQSTLEETGPLLPTVIQRFEAIAIELEESIPELTSDLRTTVDSVNQALGPDGANLLSALDALERTFASADTVLSAAERQTPEIEQTLRNLREATEHLKVLAKTLRANPSLLVRTSRKPDRKPGQGVER